MQRLPQCQILVINSLNIISENMTASSYKVLNDLLPIIEPSYKKIIVLTGSYDIDLEEVDIETPLVAMDNNDWVT